MGCACLLIPERDSATADSLSLKFLFASICFRMFSLNFKSIFALNSENERQKLRLFIENSCVARIFRSSR